MAKHADIAGSCFHGERYFLNMAQKANVDQVASVSKGIEGKGRTKMKSIAILHQ